MANKSQTQTLTQTGALFGDSNVTLAQNTVNVETTIADFTVPKDFEQVVFSGGNHVTRFVPRTSESFSVTDDDASGTLETGERTLPLSADIQPIAGETDIASQPYEAVELVNVTQGGRAAVESIDYGANEVVVDDADVAAGDTVKAYPTLIEGVLNIRGYDTLGDEQGSIPPLGIALHNWHDVNQGKKGTQMHLQGLIRATPSERIELTIDSPHQIVWTDADHPSAYVSEFSQELDVF